MFWPINKRYLRFLKKAAESLGDTPTLILVISILLSISGLITLFSASLLDPHPFFQRPFGRQLLWAIISALITTGIYYLPIRAVFTSSYILYGLGIILLMVPALIGSQIGGTTRWIGLGPFGIQPSEIMKIFVVLAIARYLATTKQSILEFKTLIPPLLFALIPMGIVLKQPDLGTSIIYFGLLFPLLYWAGARLFHLFIILAPVMSIVTAFNFYTYFLWITIVITVLYVTREKLRVSIVVFLINVILGSSTSLIWNNLKPYQQQRLLTLFNIDADPRGAGYQIIQSKIAIGSGGLFGKGLGNGTQTHLKFLPAGHTDFIFSVVGEEYGFVGTVIILILFFGLFLLCFYTAFRLKDRFSSLVIVGAVSILFFHVVINVAMTIGLMPVTGLPLPFFSYGGSFLLSCYLLIGLILNIATGR